MNTTAIEVTTTAIDEEALLDLDVLTDEELAKVGGGQGIQLLG